MALIVEQDIDNDIETLWQRVVKEPVDSDVDVILLRVHHPECGLARNSYDISILGKTIKEWVKLAFDKCNVLELSYTEGDDILQFVKPYVGHKKYTAVFYADTPLFSRKTFLSIIDYVKTKGLNVCKVQRGYVFDTEYVINAQRIFASTTPGLGDADDFFVANSMQAINNIAKILRSRIIDYYIRKGVQFLDKERVYIDADVAIGDNVVIYPGNVLQGHTEIQDNVVLYPNNQIVDSKIGQNSTISYSVVRNSQISNDSEIGPFSFVDKGKIKK
ncbi:MAG: hypothetical protein IJU58_01015 [Clostridia bacterium]|nr:hypothetical protein [Clostridia bacterium]